MKRILIPIILILIVSGTLIYFFGHKIIVIDTVWSDKDNIRIGKPLSLSVEQGRIVDYSVMEKYELWDKYERQKLADHMKSNNLKIKEGYYEFNQTTTFEEALLIFEFEKLGSEE